MTITRYIVVALVPHHVELMGSGPQNALRAAIDSEDDLEGGVIDGYRFHARHYILIDTEHIAYEVPQHIGQDGCEQHRDGAGQQRHPSRVARLDKLPVHQQLVDANTGGQGDGKWKDEKEEPVPVGE